MEQKLPIFYCNLPSISPPTYNTWPAMTTSTPCHRESPSARWGEGLWVCCCQSQKPGKCEENAEAKLADVVDRWVKGRAGIPEESLVLTCRILRWDVYLVGGNSKIFVFSSRTLGKMNPFWLIFFKGVEWNHHPAYNWWNPLGFCSCGWWIRDHLRMAGTR